MIHFVFLPRTKSTALVAAVAFCVACSPRPNGPAQSPTVLARSSATSALPPTTPRAKDGSYAASEERQAGADAPVPKRLRIRYYVAKSHRLDVQREDSGEATVTLSDIDTSGRTERSGSWKIPPSRVAALFEAVLRAARANPSGTKLPHESLFRFDVEGASPEESADVSVVLSDPAVGEFPPSVYELEHSIDDLAGTAEFLKCAHPCEAFQLSGEQGLPPVTIAPEVDRSPSDLTIEFWRTNWYMVRIYGDGEVMFVGSHHVRQRYARWTIPKADVDTLFRMATRARDMRSQMVVTSTVRLPFTPRPNEVRLVADAPACEPGDPPMLCELERSIDEITGTAAYARCGDAGLPPCAPAPGRR